MMLQALIIDDERYAREELFYLLEEYTDIKVINEVERAENAVLMIIKEEPDVVFLDIEMPKVNGIEIAKSLQKIKNSPQVIFTTAYSQFAAEAFRVDALDYLLKPYKREQLNEAINKLRSQFVHKKRRTDEMKTTKLPVEAEGEIIYIDINRIAYLYPEGKSSIIVTQNKKYEYNKSLKEAEERLKMFGFFRTHRSFLINLAYVKRMTPWFNGAYELELTGIKEKISVSRNYAKEFMKQLQI